MSRVTSFAYIASIAALGTECLGTVLSRLAREDLDPVSVGVVDERDVLVVSLRCTYLAMQTERGEAEGTDRADSPRSQPSLRSDWWTHAHTTLLGTLLELDAELVKALARGVQVVDGDADVAEAAAGLLVAAGVALEVGVGLCNVSATSVALSLGCS